MKGGEVIGTQDTGTLDPNAGGVLPLSDALTGSSFKQEQSNQSSLWGFGSMAVPVFVGILVPILLAVAIKKKTEKKRAVAVPVDAAGEPGYTLRHERYLSLLETPWEGADSIAALFEQACEANSAGNLLGTREVVARETIVSSDGRPFEKITLGKYTWITFGETFKKVVNFSSGLVKIGLEKGERVAIFAETRAEWFMALQACFRRNATVVTIYPSLGDDALVHSLNETEAGTVICDRKQLTKLVDLSNQLETVKRVVYMNEDNIKSEPTLTGASSSWTLEPFANVEKLGEEYPVEPEIPKSNDIAVIMYTSGSTGLPKGVMMSHGNIVATAAGVNTVLPELNSKDVYMCYLPLAHVLELVAEITLCAFGASLGYGSPLTLTDTSNKVKKGTKGDVSELQPTLMTAVPAIMDRVRDGVRKTIDAKGGIAKTLFEHAYHRRLAAFEGKWYGAIGPEKFLYDAVVFKKIRAVLGGRIRGVLSGGAPLSADTQRFMNICFGAPVIQGYGLTETCAGATFSDFRDTSVGRVGPPLPSTWIKLVDWDEGGYRTSDSPFPRGEIVIGGPCVTLGYFKNQQKTDECYKTDERGIRWFSTGDVGQFHPDGVLEIVDRRKDIVKLQHGEYVSLGKVEAVLAGSQYVDNVMLYADPTKAFCVALIVPKHPALEAWAQGANISFDSFSDLLNKKEATSEVQKDVAKVGKQGRLEKWEVPAKIKLLAEAWTPESGLVTSALKIKREAIKKAFSEDLNKLYS